MDRWTIWDEELGSFLLKSDIKIIDKWDLINYIGQLEDELELTKKQRNLYVVKYHVLNRILRRRKCS